MLHPFVSKAQNEMKGNVTLLPLPRRRRRDASYRLTGGQARRAIAAFVRMTGDRSVQNVGPSRTALRLAREGGGGGGGEGLRLPRRPASSFVSQRLPFPSRAGLLLTYVSIFPSKNLYSTYTCMYTTHCQTKPGRQKAKTAQCPPWTVKVSPTLASWASSPSVKTQIKRHLRHDSCMSLSLIGRPNFG